MFNLSEANFLRECLGTLVTVGMLVYTNYRNRRKLSEQQAVANAAAEERQNEWRKKTDERLQEAEDRLDSHSERFEQLNRDFTPRQELETMLSGIKQLVHSTDQWLRMMLPMLMGRVVPSGYIPLPETPISTAVKTTKTVEIEETR